MIYYKWPPYILRRPLPYKSTPVMVKSYYYAYCLAVRILFVVQG